MKPKTSLLKITIVIIFLFLSIVFIRFTEFNDHSYTLTVTDKARIYENITNVFLLMQQILYNYCKQNSAKLMLH